MKVPHYFYEKVYSKNYDCLNFACEFWVYLTGSDVASTLEASRSVKKTILKRIDTLDKPINPCFVIFQGLNKNSHVGIYVNGKVLHFSTFGLRYEELDTARIGFNKERFFIC